MPSIHVNKKIAFFQQPASFLLREWADRAGNGPSLTARALSLSGWGLSLYSAYLGGVLVEEYGEAVKPIIRQQREEQTRKASKEKETLASPR